MTESCEDDSQISDNEVETRDNEQKANKHQLNNVTQEENEITTQNTNEPSTNNVENEMKTRNELTNHSIPAHDPLQVLEEETCDQSVPTLSVNQEVDSNSENATQQKGNQAPQEIREDLVEQSVPVLQSKEKDFFDLAGNQLETQEANGVLSDEEVNPSFSPSAADKQGLNEKDEKLASHNVPSSNPSLNGLTTNGNVTVDSEFNAPESEEILTNQSTTGKDINEHTQKKELSNNVTCVPDKDVSQNDIHTLRKQELSLPLKDKTESSGTIPDSQQEKPALVKARWSYQERPTTPTEIVRIEESAGAEKHKVKAAEVVHVQEGYQERPTSPTEVVLVQEGFKERPTTPTEVVRIEEVSGAEKHQVEVISPETLDSQEMLEEAKEEPSGRAKVKKSKSFMHGLSRLFHGKKGKKAKDEKGSVHSVNSVDLNKETTENIPKKRKSLFSRKKQHKKEN